MIAKNTTITIKFFESWFIGLNNSVIACYYNPRKKVFQEKYRL